jgi:hypothetical protein
LKPSAPVVNLLVGLLVGATVLGLNAAATGAKADDATPKSTNGEAAAAPSTPASAPSSEPPPASATATPAAEPTTLAEPSAPAAAQVTYAGKVDGGAATLAISVKDGNAIAYLCDGKRLEVWLRGPAAAGRLQLTSDNGATLTGTFDEASAAGTADAAGQSFSFRIKPVTTPSGLYRTATTVANASVVGGWIVVNGEQVGVLRRNGVARPAPAIDPVSGAFTIDGVTLRAARVDGSTILG